MADEKLSPTGDLEGADLSTIQQPSVNHNAVYEYTRFSERRKWCIVGIVSFLSFLGPFSSTAVLPAVPNIAADLDTTGTIINYTNAAFLCSMAISPCIFAPISQVCVLIEGKAN
jgi:hypothetical protein